MQTVITATDLARNIRKILSQVVNQGETIGIECNYILVAQLIPYKSPVTASQLIASLKLPRLTPQQGADWLKNSKEGFDDALVDRWA